MAAANSFIPVEPEVWVHPENENYVYAWNLAQMRVGDALNIREASRALIFEWVYRNIWVKYQLSKTGDNTAAVAVLLKMFMFFPHRRVVFMIQRVITIIGRTQLGSPGNAEIDGVWGGKTHGAIYAELCNRFEPTRMALYAEIYSELQSHGAGDEALWAPILQAYVMGRI